MDDYREEYYGELTDAPAASFHGEELTVRFIGQLSKTDLGVPRSPIFEEIEDVTVSSVHLLGHELDFNTLPKTLQDSILALADNCEWA